MIVVADVNISQVEVEFLKEIEGVERVVYVPIDLRRSMPDDEIVEYALEHDALVVTRDKGFQYNPRKQWKQDYPSVLLVRHKNGLVKRVGRQVAEAVRTIGPALLVVSVSPGFCAGASSGSGCIPGGSEGSLTPTDTVSDISSASPCESAVLCCHGCGVRHSRLALHSPEKPPCTGRRPR